MNRAETDHARHALAPAEVHDIHCGEPSFVAQRREFCEEETDTDRAAQTRREDEIREVGVEFAEEVPGRTSLANHRCRRQFGLKSRDNETPAQLPDDGADRPATVEALAPGDAGSLPSSPRGWNLISGETETQRAAELRWSEGDIYVEGSEYWYTEEATSVCCCLQ